MVLDINGVHMIRVKATESKLCAVDDVQERPALLLGGGLFLLVHTLARRDHLAQPLIKANHHREAHERADVGGEVDTSRRQRCSRAR